VVADSMLRRIVTRFTVKNTVETKDWIVFVLPGKDEHHPAAQGVQEGGLETPVCQP